MTLESALFADTKYNLLFISKNLFMDLPAKPPSEQFLSLEESVKVDAALLSSPEKFLTRLTISSLKLLKHISQEYGVAIEDLTTPQVIAWFEKDSKIRREQGIEASYLKW